MKRRSGGAIKTRTKRRTTHRDISNDSFRAAIERINNSSRRRSGRRHVVPLPVHPIPRRSNNHGFIPAGAASAAASNIFYPDPSYSPPPPALPASVVPAVDLHILSPPIPVMSHFGMLRDLPVEDYPSGAIGAQSNFYILPAEVITFLDNNPIVFTGEDEYININALSRLLDDALRRVGPNYIRFIKRPPPGSPFDNDGFIRNEYKKMVEGKPSDLRKSNWIFPYIIGGTRSVPILTIPGKDVFDLPIYLMLYILKRLTQIQNSNVSVGYSFGTSTSNDQTIYPIYRTTYSGRDQQLVKIVNGKISIVDLQSIYMTLIRQFASLLPDNGDNITWNGSEDSGTRVILHNYGARYKLYLKLIFTPITGVRRGHKWTQKIEDVLTENIGTAIISVRNKDDNKCLIYCIIIGLIVKIKDKGSRVFGLSTMMVESNEVYSKAMYMFVDDDDISLLIRRLARLLLPPTYSDGDIDPTIKLIENIDAQIGTTLTVKEFREEFEKIEKLLIPNDECGIDVYGIDFNINQHIYPLYISKNREKFIELLCVTPKDNDSCSHYCVIMNMEKLLKKTGGKQFFSCSKCGECFFHKRLLKNHKCITVDDENSDGGYHFASKTADALLDDIIGKCSKCRLSFTDQFTYDYHKEHCFMEGKTGYRHVQLVTYNLYETPVLHGEEIDMESEENHIKKRRVMYADFECSINPETGDHTFMSYGIYDWKNDIYQCGYNLKEFIDFILDMAYNNEEDQIYVYFHNAMGYDANFILRYIMKHEEYKSWGIQVIMKSMNKLQKLVIHSHRDTKSRLIHIGDTFLFLTLSLERIVGSIRKDDIEVNKNNFTRFFEIFKKRYPAVSEVEIDHILRKNIFPYKFFVDSSKLDVKISDFKKIFEPKKENLEFFSERVTLEDLQKNYDDTIHVITTFNCKDARDYHDLYLCCDVMQLADVFERSMNILWESHHIHLTKYLGMPSASWAAFLRYNPDMRIPLYEDTFYAEFFKGMIRGGITSAALRYAKADDKHSIIYLDVNGLYPYVMQAYDFPCGTFTFMPIDCSGEETCSKKLTEYFEMLQKEHKGMCFCVDLKIPDSVKQITDMYPFAPEHRKIFNEYYSNPAKKELTPFLKKWSEANKGETMSEFNGLVCTLYDKIKYNVHWRLLKFYMEHGLIVTKIWFGVIFDEGDYLAGYIRKNIEIRNGRKDELGKTLYKLLGNSIYGKTFESPFKRNTYEIVRDKTKLQGLLEEGNIAAITPVDDLGWIVRMDGEDIILDKPTFIGSCVCEFAKLHMYTLLYDKLMKIFPNTDDEIGCQLVYTDTDSFIVKVKHPDGVGSSPDELFSYIKRCDPMLIGSIGGQVKSETGEDDTIQEIIALRSKVYAYITKSGHIGKRAKGTTYDAQEMQLDWETYKRTLETLTSFTTTNMQFARKTFKIASTQVERQSLSVNDGKRYICKDGIHTHAFGYPIKENE